MLFTIGFDSLERCFRWFKNGTNSVNKGYPLSIEGHFLNSNIWQANKWALFLRQFVIQPIIWIFLITLSCVWNVSFWKMLWGGVGLVSFVQSLPKTQEGRYSNVLYCTWGGFSRRWFSCMTRWSNCTIGKNLSSSKPLSNTKYSVVLNKQGGGP